MHELFADIGAVRFRLARAQQGAFEAVETEPFLLLGDGTEVRRSRREGISFLLVDHRGGGGGHTRVEFWECLAPPELERLGGLYVLCDAVRPGRPRPAGSLVPRPRGHVS